MHGYRRRNNAKKQVGFGIKSNRIFKFLANPKEQKDLDKVSNSDRLVTLYKSTKNANVTNKELSGSLNIQGKSGKTDSFRLCDKR